MNTATVDSPVGNTAIEHELLGDRLTTERSERLKKPPFWKRRPRWWGSPRSFLRAILQIDDTNHSIALGVSIGLFLGLTPTLGLQILLVVLVAMLTRRIFSFNRTAAIITVYISNPLTMVPIYYFDYWVGTLVVGGDMTMGDFRRILDYNDPESWLQALMVLFVYVGEPLIVGSLIVGAIAGLIAYPVMRWLLHSFGPSQPAPLHIDREQVASNIDSE